MGDIFMLVVGLVLGFVMGLGSAGNTYDQVVQPHITACEASLPRDQSCKIVITAVVDDGEGSE